MSEKEKFLFYSIYKINKRKNTIILIRLDTYFELKLKEELNTI